MSREIKTNVVLDGKSLVIYRLPLKQALNAFEVILNAYGEALVKLFSVILFDDKSRKSGDKKASIPIKEIEGAFTSYASKAYAGQTEQVLNKLINPDYVKFDGKPANLEELYKDHGLTFLIRLCFEVIKFNFDDFLSFG